MLKLNVCCSLIPSPRQATLGASYRSWIIRYHRAQKLSPLVSVKALKDDTNGGTSSSPGRSWEPGLEIEVPFEQRPVNMQIHILVSYTAFEDMRNFLAKNYRKVNEYSSLKEGPLYSWGELGPGPFLLRLGGLWLATFTVLGVPIAAATFNPSRGWSYVGDRLLSAVIPYEESGWYDGQMWVKPTEVLARDRLLGSYKVKPVIKMLKQTLVGTGALLVTAVMLFIFATPVEDFFQTTFATKENPSIDPASGENTKYNVRKEELLRLPVEVKADDDLAAAAAKAAGGRPVYCRDRYYRALAGGQYCKWEDLLNR
ncbi:hypothetical protein POTOM_027054 [Populus tomentosa]|uniref:Uncharacterized protein n=1 Tax=Populus tomentosa TaxID=118781 RepID=A0A8X8CVT9_POPTO|nr:hypothetical protein POTOM_027054 [Populus tomentosa]